MLANKFKTVYRIKKDTDGYFYVQVKRWYMPVWVSKYNTQYQERAIEKVKSMIDPNHNIIWTSEEAK